MEEGAFFHGTRKVFSGVSFLLDGERTALVGENGVGKSTLLQCLTGELELNRGKVIRSRNLRIGYLPRWSRRRRSSRPRGDLAVLLPHLGLAQSRAWANRAFAPLCTRSRSLPCAARPW